MLHESVIEIARYTAVMDFIISLTDGDITSGTAKARSQRAWRGARLILKKSPGEKGNLSYLANIWRLARLIV